MVEIPMKIKLVCLLCGWDWAPRTERTPRECPRCKRYKWNEAPKEAA